MGGMGFIENNKAECMLSVLINTNLLRSSIENKIKKYFFSSSACVYNGLKQSETFIEGLKEEDARNLIVMGFCKEIFQKLPMEFAVEANNY